MKLLDVYAVNCGATIDKPFIYESYFPAHIEKYITLQAQSQQHIDAKHYSYWQDVIDMIVPFLGKNNIHILQVGQQHEQAYERVIDLRGKTNVNQLAYLFRRSQLHVGPDSFGVHLASGFDVPIVGLYSVSMAEIVGPQFGSPEKHVLLKGYSRSKNGKPHYAYSEEPKSINLIKPEEVAHAIFKLLRLDATLPFETIFTGKRYNSQTIRELIPNSPVTLNNPEVPIEIRADLFYDDNLLGHHLSYLKRGIIVTDKPLNLAILKYFKGHIPLVVYRITENDNPKFVKDLLALGFSIMLVSELPEDILNNKKIDYYEYGQINAVAPIDQITVDKLKPELDKLYYKSCKYVVNNGKLFASHAAVIANKELSNSFEYQKVIDSPQFWKDLEFCTIVRKT